MKFMVVIGSLFKFSASLDYLTSCDSTWTQSINSQCLAEISDVCKLETAKIEANSATVRTVEIPPDCTVEHIQHDVKHRFHTEHEVLCNSTKMNCGVLGLSFFNFLSVSETEI